LSPNVGRSTPNRVGRAIRRPVIIAFDGETEPERKPSTCKTAGPGW
jgi:hypothetical protein